MKNFGKFLHFQLSRLRRFQKRKKKKKEREKHEVEMTLKASPSLESSVIVLHYYLPVNFHKFSHYILTFFTWLVFSDSSPTVNG